ncbi:hypothetical protein [Niameybacter sp.]|uniref:hypothetical protein n=1 Tax=Niameybacter sp. TaxID=2033640 RepID=UPI002FCB6A9A
MPITFKEKITKYELFGEKLLDFEYVLIDHCKYGRYGEVISGRVAYYSKDIFDNQVKNMQIDTDYCTLALTDNGKGLNLLI